MKIRRKLLAAAVCIGLLGGCTGYESSTTQDGISYHISKNGKKAFAAECSWDVNNGPARIVIPEQIGNAKVVSLGGFFGIGVPAPFCLMGTGSYDFNGYPYRSLYGAPLVLEDVPVTVVIPDTAEEVKGVTGTGYYGSRDENGQIVFRRPVIRFACSENNKHFTVINGELYAKGEEERIGDEGLYGKDELPPVTLRDRLLCRCVKDMGEEKEVWDIIPEFGRVFIHINSYMEDSEYMFSALELIPLEEGVLERMDTDTFDAEVKQFSDFAMAGQYTEADYPYYRVTVTEDSVKLIGLDENREPVTDSELELEQDITQPSQFAVTAEDLERVNDGSRMSYPVSYYLEKVTTHRLEGDGIWIRIYRDGTITIRKDAENTTELYRGITVGTDGKEYYDLRFALKKLGGTTEPITGRVHMTIGEDTVTFTPAEGYESRPLIEEGTESLECRIS